MTTFTSNRKERLRLDGQAALSRARALADTAKSEGRGLTTSEQSAYDEAIAKRRTAADGLRKMAPCRTCAGSPPPPRGGAGSTCAVTPTPFPTITARPGDVFLTALSVFSAQ